MATAHLSRQACEEPVNQSALPKTECMVALLPQEAGELMQKSAEEVSIDDEASNHIVVEGFGTLQLGSCQVKQDKTQTTTILRAANDAGQVTPNGVGGAARHNLVTTS